ncbi:MAG: glycosyltransferase [Actinobacteria bacterium]|nr:glycosyltransferase [Actinomycetota bacterium]
MTHVPVALAHDYLTQRGGAERALLALARAFPSAPIHTTVHEPSTTYDEFARHALHTTPLQHVGPMRRNPRLALPVLAPVVERHRIDAQVTICQTTGWSHGMDVSGIKVVYAHNTARWLYQQHEYLANLPRSYRWGLSPLTGPLRRWDRRAAGTADVVYAGSGVARDRIRTNWGRDAEVVYPPPGLAAEGDRRAVDGLEPGFVLTIARLLPYKRVDVVIEAVRELEDPRLVVVGEGPDAERLAALAPSSTRFLPVVADSELRWLYANARALATASQEDFGLTPLEAMGFGTPVVVIAAGGFLETVEPEVSGIFFDAPDARSLRRALERAATHDWDREAMQARAETFSEASFIRRFQDIVTEVAGG